MQHIRPSALREWPALARTLENRPLAIFLDYDGTLTPIVARPDLAILGEPMREALRRLSAVWPTHIISGRGLEDVQRLVGIDSLWYAGSHGFDIAPPRGIRGGKQLAPELEPAVHRAAEELRRATAAIPGVLVEDKRFSVAVHYRLVDQALVAAIERMVDNIEAGCRGLKKAYGKKVFELRPAMDWDKGKALLWLLEATGLTSAFPVYVGDDVTDEDAFAVLTERGMGILVSEQPRPTAASYSLRDTSEVGELLERLASLTAG